MDRLALALTHIDAKGRGLEIGPSYNPWMPKSSWPRVETIDHASRDELVEKFGAFGLTQDRLDRIDEVDHVWTGGSLVDAIGPTEPYDFVLASHVIEHSVDIIAFLQDCQQLLRPGGVLALVVPDKRFCFDLYQPLTSLGTVIDAHLRPTAFHPPGALVDHHAYACAINGTQIAWSGPVDKGLALQFATLDGVPELIAQGAAQAAYVDVHRWRFTPSWFLLLLQDLGALGYTDLAALAPPHSEGHEFFVPLQRRPKELISGDRQALIDETMRELQVVMGPSQDMRAASATSEPSAAALAQARAELSALRGSSSWRITAPLRAASRLVRRRP